MMKPSRKEKQKAIKKPNADTTDIERAEERDSDAKKLNSS